MFKYTNRSIILRIQSQKKLREIELRKISTKTEKQTIWILIKAQREKEDILEKRRQRYLNTSLRSWQSLSLTEIDQSRYCKQT